MRVFALLVTASIAVAGLQSPASAADMDCGDFGSQKAAQIFFLNNNPAADPHRLDADADGDWVVCESNPAPYYYGRDPSPGGTPATPPPSAAAPAPLKVVKVLDGDLVRLRQGSAKPYDVRLIGLRIPGNNSCINKGARRYLKTVAKPGQVVTLVKDKKSPPRDGQGHLIAEVKPKNGAARSGFSTKVVTNGWAMIQPYKFAAKKSYLRLMADADDAREGAFGNCIKDYGSSRHPYRVGTMFEVDGWRYTFGATDFDALSEMLAEQAAAAPGTVTFTPPKAGATFRRIPVTATRLNGRANTPGMALFGYVSGDTIMDVASTKYGSCGTSATLLDQMKVAPGQTVTGYLCTAKPAHDGIIDEMWAVADPKSSLVLRYVVAS